jgi:hypothetical protein
VTRVEFEGHDCQLVVPVVPDHAGWMYTRPLTAGPRRLAPVASLKLRGFVGGRGLGMGLSIGLTRSAQ